MLKLLSIIGPTATGKTSFAVELAKELSNKFSFIDIISSDSRQIYKGMEVGTGVDLPQEKLPHIRFHGFSMVQPDEEWSVMQFQNFTHQVIQQSWYENGLPILVGGTGFYQHHLFGSQTEMQIPPNEEVRQKAALMTLSELQTWAEKTAPKKFTDMNESDQKNPRRLVRVIEIGVGSVEKKEVPETDVPSDVLTIGLTDSIEHISQKIQQRVEERLAEGMINETQTLMAHYNDEIWRKFPAFSATGYKEVRAFLEDKLSKEEMITLWNRRELQYAKRQRTWFKKYAQDALWFTVSENGWQTKAKKQIQAWLLSPERVY